MNREIILGFVKVTLLGVLAILLLIRIWQDDATEQRMLDVAAASDRQGERLRGVGDRVDAVATRVDGIAERVDGIAREIAAGVRVTPGTDAPTAPPPQVPTGDPRTLGYWATPDNILMDPSGEPHPPPDAPRGGILKYFISSNPKTLNVLTSNEAELQERICAPVYEFIADQSRVDPDQYVPGICNRVTVNEDFTEFTCYVRKGCYWQKPYLTAEQKRGKLAWLDRMPRQEVTAEDIKFTFDMANDPLSQCGDLSAYLTDLESVEVVDPYVIKVRWKRSLYYNKTSTLNLLMIYPKFVFTRDENGKVLPEDQVATTFSQHWFNNMMCGTGPFIFAGFEANQVIRLRRNPDYWGPKAALDGVDVFVLQEPTVRLSMFKAGELDVLYGTAADYNAEILQGGKGSIKELVDEGKVLFKKWEMFSYYYIGWNLRNKRLQDRNVRLALAYLYPMEKVVRDILFGLAVPHNGPVHRWEPHWVKDMGWFPYDVEKAKQLLDEAGWKANAQGVREKVVDGEKLELRLKLLYATQSPAARDMAQLYAQSALEAGIMIEPQPREWMVMLQMVEDKEFDSVIIGWGNSWDNDPSQLWSSESARAPKGSNHVSYINPKLDEVIDKLKTEFDQKKRHELWREFQRIVIEDQPYRFTYIGVRPWFIWNKFGNVSLCKLRPQDWFYPWYMKAEK